jgi:16S rRNA (guanine1207-N2)-methyltransferase
METERETPRAPIRISLGSPRDDAREEAFLEGRIAVRSRRGVRAADRLLLEALGEPLRGRLLVVAAGEPTVALAAALLHPDAEVHAFYLDAYEHGRAAATVRAHGGGVRLRLGADLPEEAPFQHVIFAVPRASDALLIQELVAGAHRVLAPGGKLLAATDSPRGRSLHARILETFGDVTIALQGSHGAVLVARKRPGSRPRERDFRRSFTARPLGATLELETRPGVFAHGRLDSGALALAESAVIERSTRGLDLGCGSGAIGIALALAAPAGGALLVDSNARAVAAARANAVKNRAANALVILAQDLSAVRPGSIDLVLANPPYFGDYRIVERFAREGRRVLRPGGRFLLVTKTPARPGEIIEAVFGNRSVAERRGYAVVSALRR